MLIFTGSDNAPVQLKERVARKYLAPSGVYVAPAKKKYDAIVIGGGHNGLVSAAYLAQEGKWCGLDCTFACALALASPLAIVLRDVCEAGLRQR